MDRKTIGSQTAKGGFSNEHDICSKFNNWKKNDNEAKEWLAVMGYSADKIQQVTAVQIPVRISLSDALQCGITESKYDETIRFKKADMQLRVFINFDGIVYFENLSLKKANTGAAYNQVDKRPVSTYKDIWHFDNEIEKWLKLFTGETSPNLYLNELGNSMPRDPRRLFLTEIPVYALERIISFFHSNINLVINDILRGRGGLSADWMLVTRKIPTSGQIDWVLKDMNTVCNFYAQGGITLSPKGSLKIGRITMQRKGGTPDPTSLQFKMNPLELFEVE